MYHVEEETVIPTTKTFDYIIRIINSEESFILGTKIGSDTDSDIEILCKKIYQNVSQIPLDIMDCKQKVSGKKLHYLICLKKVPH